MHEMMAKGMIASFFGSDSVKGVVLSVLLAAAGWIGHIVVTSRTDPLEETLAAHTKQIDALTQTTQQTQQSIQGLVVATTAINGKIDILNTKIDDDRRHDDKRSASK